MEEGGEVPAGSWPSFAAQHGLCNGKLGGLGALSSLLSSFFPLK